MPDASSRPVPLPRVTAPSTAPQVCRGRRSQAYRDRQHAAKPSTSWLLAHTETTRAQQPRAPSPSLRSAASSLTPATAACHAAPCRLLHRRFESQATMQIFLRALTGDIITLDVESSDRVESIRARVQVRSRQEARSYLQRNLEACRRTHPVLHSHVLTMLPCHVTFLSPAGPRGHPPQRAAPHLCGQAAAGWPHAG